MRFIIKIGVMLGLVALSFGALAAPPPERMNMSRVQVADQSPATMRQALPKALSQVLVRMSGDANVMQDPSLRSLLTKSRSWLQNYSYETEVRDNGAQLLFLRASFNQRALSQLLRKANKNVWENRPNVMVWLHVQQGNLSYYLAGNDHRGLTSDLKNFAYQRGLLYSLPLMDYQDQSLFNIQDPKSFTPDALNELVKRYGSQAVLVGNVFYGQDNNWHGNWYLLSNGNVQDWDNSSDNLETLLPKTVSKTIALLTKRPEAVVQQESVAPQTQQLPQQQAQPQQPSQQPLTAQQVQLTVEGIERLDDYDKLVKYLQSLSTITNVDVKDMNRSVVTLTINVQGGARGLAAALRNSPYLTALSDSRYRWTNNNSSDNNAAPAYNDNLMNENPAQDGENNDE